MIYSRNGGGPHADKSGAQFAYITGPFLFIDIKGENKGHRISTEKRKQTNIQNPIFILQIFANVHLMYVQAAPSMNFEIKIYMSAEISPDPGSNQLTENFNRYL